MTGPRSSAPTLSAELRRPAAAYSTCLAYSGTWQRQGDTVIHRLTDSLYPNWLATVQPRAIEDRDGDLFLRTPEDGRAGVVNEVSAHPDPVTH